MSINSPGEVGKAKFTRLIQRPGMERFQLASEFYNIRKAPLKSFGANCDIYLAETEISDGQRTVTKVAIKCLRVCLNQEDSIWKVINSHRSYSIFNCALIITTLTRTCSKNCMFGRKPHTKIFSLYSVSALMTTNIRTWFPNGWSMEI